MLRPGRGGAGYGSPYPQAQSPYGAAGGYASPGGDYGGYNTNNNHNESNNNNNQGGGQSYGGYTGGNNAAYGGYSPPPPPSNGSFKDKKRKSKNSNAFLQSLRDPLTWVGLLAIVCFLVAVRFRFHETTFLKHAKAKSLTHALEVLRTATLERDTMRREYRTLQETHKASAATIQQHEEDKRKMLDHVHELEGQHSKHQHHQNNNNNNSEEVAVWKTQAKELKESIGREARRAASERYVKPLVG